MNIKISFKIDFVEYVNAGTFQDKDGKVIEYGNSIKLKISKEFESFDEILGNVLKKKDYQVIISTDKIKQAYKYYSALKSKNENLTLDVSDVVFKNNLISFVSTDISKPL